MTAESPQPATPEPPQQQQQHPLVRNFARVTSPQFEYSEDKSRRYYRNRPFPVGGDVCGHCRVSVASAVDGFGFCEPYFACRPCKNDLINKGYKSSLQGYLRFLLQRTKNRSKTTGKPWPIEITIIDLMRLWEEQQGKCALTGLSLMHSHDADKPERLLRNASIDRIDSALGYLRNNVQLVCSRINQMKSSLPQPVFIDLCLHVTRHQDLARQQQQQQEERERERERERARERLREQQLRQLQELHRRRMLQRAQQQQQQEQQAPRRSARLASRRRLARD